MFEFLRRKNAPVPEPDGETKALPEAPAEDEGVDDSVLKGAVEAMLVDQAVTEEERAPEIDSGPPMNVIGADTRVEGSIVTRSVVRVLGEIDGDLECVAVTIEEDAEIRGDVTAVEDVVVHGTIVGDLVVHGKLTISATGRVTGRVDALSISVVDGAELHGHCSVPTSGTKKDAAANLSVVTA